MFIESEMLKLVQYSKKLNNFRMNFETIEKLSNKLKFPINIFAERLVLYCYFQNLKSLRFLYGRQNDFQ